MVLCTWSWFLGGADLQFEKFAWKLFARGAGRLLLLTSQLLHPGLQRAVMDQNEYEKLVKKFFGKSGARHRLVFICPSEDHQRPV